MIVFGREPAHRFMDEAKPLFEAHWREVGLDQDSIRLNVDYDRFLALDAAGGLACFTARDTARCVQGGHRNGPLAGYAVFMVSPHIHYRDHVMAYCDVVYLAARGPRTALRFFQHMITDMTLRDDVVKFFFHEKTGNDYFGRLLQKKFGAKHAENLWTVTVI